MTHKYYSAFWITLTVLIFGGLAVILLPWTVQEYGAWGVALLAPLLIIAAVLAYIRGYWVSRWMQEWREKRHSRGK